MTNGMLARLEKNLKEVKETFDKLNELGFDRELLEVYIAFKTKMSKKDVKEMLKGYQEFVQDVSI